MRNIERFAELRFFEAAQTYREGHQACIACRRSHCVFFSAWDLAEEYRCFECGYCVWRELGRGAYLSGYEQTEGVDVLADTEPALLDDLEDHPILRGS